MEASIRSPDFYPRRSSVASAESDISSASSATSLNSVQLSLGRVEFDPTGSPSFRNAGRTKKIKGNVMNVGYSRVKKTTTSMFRVKSRTSNIRLANDMLAVEENPISLVELDARLEMLETSPPHTLCVPLPTPFASSEVSLIPHYTTPQCEIGPPMWQNTHVKKETRHPEPQAMVAKSRTEQAFLYLGAGVIAIPSLAMSYPPMTITLILASAVAVLCGFRSAVAIPVLMLLNPASPLWHNDDKRKKGEDVFIVAPRHAHTHHKRHSHHSHSAAPPPFMRLPEHARRHSACC